MKEDNFYLDPNRPLREQFNKIVLKAFTNESSVRLLLGQEWVSEVSFHYTLSSYSGAYFIRKDYFSLNDTNCIQDLFGIYLYYSTKLGFNSTTITEINPIKISVLQEEYKKLKEK